MKIHILSVKISKKANYILMEPSGWLGIILKADRLSSASLHGKI